MAGLRAAWLLQSQWGLAVAVVEARDRVGGRAHTVQVPVEGLPAPVDMGGQWLGPQQPLSLDLCRRFGLVVEEQAWPAGGDVGGKVAMAAAAGLAAPPLSDGDAADMDRVDGLLRQLSAQARGAREPEKRRAACEWYRPGGGPAAGLYAPPTLDPFELERPRPRCPWRPPGPAIARPSGTHRRLTRGWSPRASPPPSFASFGCCSTPSLRRSATECPSWWVLANQRPPPPPPPAVPVLLAHVQ